MTSMCLQIHTADSHSSSVFTWSIKNANATVLEIENTDLKIYIRRQMKVDELVSDVRNHMADRWRNRWRHSWRFSTHFAVLTCQYPIHHSLSTTLFITAHCHPRDQFIDVSINHSLTTQHSQVKIVHTGISNKIILKWKYIACRLLARKLNWICLHSIFSFKEDHQHIIFMAFSLQRKKRQWRVMKKPECRYMVRKLTNIMLGRNEPTWEWQLELCVVFLWDYVRVTNCYCSDKGCG